MNKLYGIQGNLIGYASDGINTADKKKLFNLECKVIIEKLIVLGVAEYSSGKYYIVPLNNYYKLQGLEIRDGIPYFKHTDIEWKYNLSSYCGTFTELGTPEVDILTIDTINTADMCGMFAKAHTRILNLERLNTDKVTCMSSMFLNYKADSALDLSSFNTHIVNDMNYMFSSCGAKSINLSSFDVRNVEHMNGMFWSCKAESLDISSFDLSNIALLDLSYMFYKSNIKHIKINLLAFIKVLKCEAAFDNKIMTMWKFIKACKIVRIK